MDKLLEGLSSTMNHLQFDHGLVSVYSNQKNFDEFILNNHLIDPPDPRCLQTNPNPPTDLTPSSSMNKYADPADISEPFQATLRYINDMLMEEDLGDKTCMLQDCLALHAAEKSFYDVLGQKYPTSPNQFPSCLNHNSESQEYYCTTSSSANSTNGSTNNLDQPNWVSNQGQFISSLDQTSLIDSPESTFLIPNLYSGIQPFRLCSDGGKASNYLPNDDTVNPKISSSNSREEVVVSIAKDRRDSSPYGSRGRRSYQVEDSNYLEAGRSNKHFAHSRSEYEPSEVFDEALLCKCENKSVSCSLHGLWQDGSSGEVQETRESKASNGGTTRTKKKGKKTEVVDLLTLLTACAQALTSYDQRTASQLLKQVRQHSSPFGDGTQRLAHYFADGLDARLAGTHTPISLHLSIRASASDIIQAYKLHVTSCPFHWISSFMANRTILKISEKATRLHIIDFGIGYGFQWPCLIQRASKRPGGPPKIRITGIDFPQPGFRPAERVEETIHRLKSYCERFNVPSECNAIAQKWHNIQLEDLKIDREEITVVNCTYRLRNLPDDTVDIDSPRDAVLELIKKINPDIFIHGVVSGTYDSPFFLARFREALFHFSALFDMLEATLPREDQGRMLFEREIYGKEAINVISCEGIERVERPESYKHWHARNLRTGFRQLPLDKDILNSARTLGKLNYHPDFVIDEAGQWLLQGWKGRLTHALSVWKPVQD